MPEMCEQLEQRIEARVAHSNLGSWVYHDRHEAVAPTESLDSDSSKDSGRDN